MSTSRVLQSADVGQPPLPKKMVQDASFEVCHEASLIQIAMNSANLAAQADRPYDVKQCFRTIRALMNTINMHLERLEEMVQR